MPFLRGRVIHDSVILAGVILAGVILAGVILAGVILDGRRMSSSERWFQSISLRPYCFSFVLMRSLLTLP
jgi:ABC-type polysaccharide transport system permease subunit